MDRRNVGILRRFGWLVSLLAGLLLVLAGCGAGEGTSAQPGESAGEASLAQGSFVGRVAGSDALLALLSNGEQVAGYLCDGEQVSVWLQAREVTAGGARLVGRDGTDYGTVTVTDTSATGTVILDGVEHSFTLEPATGEAGLYRGFADLGEGESVEVGWIVLNDGAQTGAVATRTPSGVTLAAAPSLDPGAGTATLDRVGALAVQHLTAGFIDKVLEI